MPERKELEDEQEEPWQIVNFAKKKSHIKRPIPANSVSKAGINVKLFHAETGKYLDSMEI